MNTLKFVQPVSAFMVGKAQVFLITLTMAVFYLSVPVSQDSVTVSQHEQYQDPETEAAKWNSAIIHFIIYTCAFPTVTVKKPHRARLINQLGWYISHYFDNWFAVLVIFQAKMQNICWLQLLNPHVRIYCFFPLINDSKLNIFGFWTIARTKQGIWRRHIGLWNFETSIFHHFLTFF